MQLCHFTPPDVKAIISYVAAHYVVCKTKYCSVFFKLAISNTPKPTVQKKS